MRYPHELWPHAGSRSRIAERRLAVAHAIGSGESEAIVAGYLALAWAFVDVDDRPRAITELEAGVRLLSGIASEAPSWRLLLSLAMLYDDSGDSARSLHRTRAALDEATRTGSQVGRARAAQRLRRFGR